MLMLVNDFVSFGFELNDSGFDEMCADQELPFTENNVQITTRLWRLDERNY